MNIAYFFAAMKVGRMSVYFPYDIPFLMNGDEKTTNAAFALYDCIKCNGDVFITKLLSLGLIYGCLFELMRMSVIIGDFHSRLALLFYILHAPVITSVSSVGARYHKSPKMKTYNVAEKAAIAYSFAMTHLVEVVIHLIVMYLVSENNQSATEIFTSGIDFLNNVLTFGSELLAKVLGKKLI